MPTPAALVTGDIVLDSHLYGGVKTSATSQQEPGTVQDEHLGGASLSYRIMDKAADAKGIAWDAKKDAWDKRAAQKSVSLPWPEKPDDERPSASYGTHLGIDETGLKD